MTKKLPRPTQKHLGSSGYSETFVSTLSAFLAAPPEPPRRKLTLVDVLTAVAPQVRALFDAGYGAEQIREFLAAKGISPNRTEVSKFLRQCSGRVRRSTKDGVEEV